MKFQFANYVTLHKCAKHEYVKYDLRKYSHKETRLEKSELSPRVIYSNTVKYKHDSGVTKSIFMKYWMTLFSPPSNALY